MAEAGSDRGDSPGSAACQSTDPAALLHPLADLWARAGRPLPALEVVAMGELPAPARALLAHERGMTACLAERYGAPIGLRVLARVHQGTRYVRQVVLTAGDGGRALALAAVELDLDRLPPEGRAGVLAERVPLGTVLAGSGPAFRRVVAATFRIRRDAVLTEALGPAAPPWCHGRRTLLLAPDSRVAATLVEILPL